MDFEPSQRCSEFKERLTAFMDEHIYPAEAVYERQLRESGDPHHQPQVIEELKVRARESGLWNMFLPDPEQGAGLSNTDYAPLAEILGRSRIASEACNCSAPDTGNMEVLHQFGTPEQNDRWLTTAAGGRDPLVVRDDRARRRELGCDQHRDAHRTRRRALRAQRSQVVDLGRIPPPLPDHDRDGQDQDRGAQAQAAEHDPRALRHPRRQDPAQPAGVRLRRPGGPRGSRLRGRARTRLQPDSG